MVEKINTGKYRIRKEIIGRAGTRQTVQEFDNFEDCKAAFSRIKKVDEYIYYMEEETFYRGTQWDMCNNPIDSSSGWTRI